MTEINATRKEVVEERYTGNLTPEEVQTALIEYLQRQGYHDIDETTFDVKMQIPHDSFGLDYVDWNFAWTKTETETYNLGLENDAKPT